MLGIVSFKLIYEIAKTWLKEDSYELYTNLGSPKKVGISSRRIQVLCAQGRIPGVAGLCILGLYLTMQKNLKMQGLGVGNILKIIPNLISFSHTYVWRGVNAGFGE